MKKILCHVYEYQNSFSFHVSGEIADSFYSRLRGICALSKSSTFIYFPRCRAVHTLGLTKPIFVYFLNENGQVIQLVENLKPCRFLFNTGARHVIESFQRLPVQIGQRIKIVDEVKMPRGFSLVETLLALPIVLFVGFVALQLGLLWQAKLAVSHAATTAARHASLHHGSDGAIRDGLVTGLMPWVGRLRAVEGLIPAIFRTNVELTEGIARGWLRWRVLSPTQQSFSDWGEPVDPFFSPDASRTEIEIPSAMLSSIALRRQPKSGVQGYSGNLPIGRESGQTLIDANYLKLYVQVGIPLNIPLAGTLLARALAVWADCGWGFLSDVSSRDTQIGLVRFGPSQLASPLSTKIECRALAATDFSGKWKPRWPVSASAIAQMHSNSRQSLMILENRTDSKRE